MARRISTHLVLVIIMLFTGFFAGKAQVTFTLTPNKVTPAVGDTVKIDVVVTNFTNITSLQMQYDWDPLLFDTINPMVVPGSVTLPNASAFGGNVELPNLLRTSWIPGGSIGTVPNGQKIFSFRLKVKAASSNYWVRIISTSDLEITQNGNQVTPVLGNVGTPPDPAYVPVTVKTSTHSVQVSENFCVGVTADNFTNMTTANWNMKWDSSILVYQSLTKFNTTLGLSATNFTTTQAVANGRLNFANTSTTAKTLPAGDTLYKVCFLPAAGSVGKSTQIQTLTTGALANRTINGGSVAVGILPTNGTVTITSGPPPPPGVLTFSATNETGSVGDTVCVKIYAKNFKDVAIMTWSMHWDSTKLSVVKARVRTSQFPQDSLILAQPLPPLPAATYTSIVNTFTYKTQTSGTLQFLGDLSNSPVTLTGDSTLILDVCLKVIGGTNTTSNFTFDGIPLKLKILDPNVVTIPTTTVNSVITIANAAVPAIVASGNKTDVSCNGGNNGAVTLTVSGGTSTYTYAWTGPGGFSATTKDITARTAGAYSVTITSSTATPVVLNFTLTEPAIIASTETATNVNCFGQSTGSINLTTPTGGTAPFSYLWSNGGETTKDISGKAAGSYTVTITDSKSCKLNKTIVITQPAVGLAASNTITPITCNGGTDGAIALTVSNGTPGYTYSWTGPSSFTAATKDISALKAGNYAVTITDTKNCALTLGPINIADPVVIVATPTITNASCASSTGAISIAVAGGTGPYTYAWTGPSFTATTKDISGLAVGSYTVEITDSKSCKSTSTPFSVSTNNPNFTVTTNTVTNVSCNAGTNGAITINVSGAGPYTYTWAGPSFSAITKDVSALRAGSYTVTVTETATSCKVIPAAFTITEPAVLAIPTPNVLNVRCKGDKSGEITIAPTGGNGGFSYNWSGPSGFTAANTSAIGPLFAGDYNVTVTDSKGCIATRIILVTEPTGNALAIGSTPSVTNVKCNGNSTGAIAISVTGGTTPYTFNWSGPSFTSALQNPSNLVAGTYNVTVTDLNGCKNSKTGIIIDQPNVLAVSGVVTNAVSACNGKIDISVTGGASPYSYVWAGKDVAVNNEDQLNLCPGETYTVTVTDANGCTVSKPFTVTGTIAPPIGSFESTVISQAGCPGQTNGAISITFSGGKAPFTFEWLNANNQIVGFNQNITSLAAGKYRIRIKDAVNQTFTSPEIDIKESASTIAIVVDAIKKQTCGTTDDGEIRITATGGGTLNYRWSSGPTSKDLLNIKEGTYSVTVSDNNGCSSEKKDILVGKDNCPLTVTNTPKPGKCSTDNSSVTVNILNGEPGYLIKWGASASQEVRINNTPSRTGTYDVTGLPAGAYSITVTDSKGQSTTTTGTITAPTPIVINKVVTNDGGNCSGSIVLDVTGGTPQYTYVWNDGTRSKDRFNLCTNAILSVTVTDANGCFASTKNDTIRYSVTPLVLANTASITNAACPEETVGSGSIDITVQGGVAPYKFAWSDGGTTEDRDKMKAGTYTVTVSDNTLPTPQKVFGTYIITTTSTLKIKDLVATTSAATVTVEGGEAPYTYKWCNGQTQNSPNTTISQSNLAGGACGVTITDNKGCSVSRKFDITTVCAVVTTTALPCYNSKGSATVQTVTDQTLTPPYNYRWDNNETGVTAVQMTSGSRTVTVVGNNGKTCIANFIMRAPEEVKVVVSAISASCGLDALVTGGVAPYKYTWSTPKKDTTAKVENLDNGTNYFVIVKDANGCVTDPKVQSAVCSTFCLKGIPVITPNDDAKNDKFEIEKCDFKNVRLQVYNRWGQLVYQNEDYTNQWEGFSLDGKTGKELPDGVYMYTLRGVEPNGKITTNKGTVNILR